MNMEDIIVTEQEAGQRLDLFLTKRCPGFSRAYFQDLIAQQLVLVNGKACKKRILVCVGDEIDIEFAMAAEPALTPEYIPFDILYEDDVLLAINKPAGLVVHPGAGHWSHTFVNGLIYHCQHLQQQAGLRPGIVHRLDKETSGVLLAAKTRPVQQHLVAAFAERRIHKVYLAVCQGHPKKQTLHNRIARHPIKRQRMAIVATGGREAITHLVPLKSCGRYALIMLMPETGRTHQLRVQLQHAGFPILGDPVYHPHPKQGSRQLLHAYKLTLHHPITGTLLELTAPPPPDIGHYIQTT